MSDTNAKAFFLATEGTLVFSHFLAYAPFSSRSAQFVVVLGAVSARAAAPALSRPSPVLERRGAEAPAALQRQSLRAEEEGCRRQELRELPARPHHVGWFLFCLHSRGFVFRLAVICDERYRLMLHFCSDVVLTFG